MDGWMAAEVQCILMNGVQTETVRRRLRSELLLSESAESRINIYLVLRITVTSEPTANVLDGPLVDWRQRYGIHHLGAEIQQRVRCALELYGDVVPVEVLAAQYQRCKSEFVLI